jgi:hypothetical protein
LENFSKNTVFWSAFIAWALAQFLKGLFALYKYKRLDFRRFVGAGGMPSSHSAFVSALATGIGLKDGWASTTFALAVVFALIVMYDAAGVRLAASKQAATLNKIIDELFDEGEFHHEHLKELLGHTPIEVFAGSLLGIVISCWFVG